MPSGQGPIDYVVVLATLLVSAYLLFQGRPGRLLLYLPLFVTIDFFIPALSHLTPARLIPLLIGFWWIVSSAGRLRHPVSGWLGAGLLVIFISTAYAMMAGDAGVRPAFRALYYINLVILCAFACQYGGSGKGAANLLKGFALAGVVHGFYAIYQYAANQLGLPYRGIVYSAGSTGSGIGTTGAFRMNGFADEPKRLGLILLASVVSIVYLSARQNEIFRRNLYLAVALCVFAVSLMTFSTSYLVGLILWMPVALLLSHRSVKYGIGVGLVLLAAYFAMPSSVGHYVEEQQKLIEDREREFEEGLEADIVYRQEFWAGEHLKNHPLDGITGVGMGRYNKVFFDAFGEGAGMGGFGHLLPLNSQIMEVSFDLGLAGVFLIYAGSALVILRVRSRGLGGYVLAAIISFELIQSLLVQSLQILVLAAGCGAGVLWNERVRRAKSRPGGWRRRTRQTSGPTIGKTRPDRGAHSGSGGATARRLRECEP